MHPKIPVFDFESKQFQKKKYMRAKWCFYPTTHNFCYMYYPPE